MRDFKIGFNTIRLILSTSGEDDEFFGCSFTEGNSKSSYQDFFISSVITEDVDLPMVGRRLRLSIGIQHVRRGW